jgi:very-short-patch-repair endonuclease
MGEKSARPDVTVERIATRQHGVVSIQQLRDAGLGRNAVSLRVRTGRLHRLHQGVYAVGHRAMSFPARCMAAILASGSPADDSGDGTVLGCWSAAVSHRSAAELWGLMALRDGPIHVSVPGESGRRSRRGIRLHRSSSLLPASVTLRSGVPVTTPSRTIADLRRASAAGRPSAVSAQELRRAIRQADVLGLALDEDMYRDGTRSELERLFLCLCRRAGLPRPEVNVRVGRYLVDFLWRSRCLIVETDGYRYHRGRAAFEDDRARDLELRAAGYQTIRLSQRQVLSEPDRVAAAVAKALVTSD